MQGIESYLRELERRLDCPRHIRKPFLDKTRQMAREFTQGRPEATRQEIADCLGEPRELAQGFLDSLDVELLDRHQRKKKFIRWGLAALAIALILMLGAWVYVMKTQPLHMEFTETLVIER